MENFKLTNLFTVKGISAPSGLLYYQDVLFLISDSSNFIYQYDISKKLLLKFPLVKEAKENIEKALELLTYFGLENRAQHKPTMLSGGEQQRVAVARALINDPKIIFADEPSGNLDSSSAESLHQLFFELRDKFNQTFIIVTHNEELANMADRKLTMKDGTIL